MERPSQTVAIHLFAALVPFVALALAAPAAAQPTRPIYPVYEGYVPNEDGTATLVFGYYSHNAVAVEIPAGEANGFEPGPIDRGQPTTFEPGRQRNTCLIVLPDDDETNLRWKITWGAHTQTTTENGGVNPLYLIENISSAYRRAQELDTGAAERGVCLEPPDDPLIPRRQR